MENLIKKKIKNFLGQLYLEKKNNKILKNLGTINSKLKKERYYRVLQDYGWIENCQSYFNNSLEWWFTICERVSLKCKFFDSSWQDKISVRKWMIVSKND